MLSSVSCAGRKVRNMSADEWRRGHSAAIKLFETRTAGTLKLPLHFAGDGGLAMSKRTVVVVEDDALLRSDAVALLDAVGLEVADFETADEAAAYLKQHDGEVAAIFTDVRTPGLMDGFDLALEVSIRWPGIKVLMTSGLDRPTSLLIPSVAFLPKPWLPLDVLTAVQDAAGCV